MHEDMTNITVESMQMMQEYLMEHMDDYSLKDMADRFAMSQTRLQSCFLDEYGMSIYAYRKSLQNM